MLVHYYETSKVTIESVDQYIKLMASNENHCVGCGDGVQPGQ